MLICSTPSVSDSFDIDQALTRLSDSPFVDGIAAFGSRAANQTYAVSDYDLFCWSLTSPLAFFKWSQPSAGASRTLFWLKPTSRITCSPPPRLLHPARLRDCLRKKEYRSFTKGDTAIVLMDSENVVQIVSETLAFWNSLFYNV